MKSNLFVFRVKGGLGSQMLAYATSYALKKKRKDAVVIADFNYFREKIENRWGHILTPQLKYVFNIDEHYLPAPLYKEMMRSISDKRNSECAKVHRAGDNFNFDSSIFEQEGFIIFTNNSWCSWEYFDEFQDDIKELYKFTSYKRKENIQLSRHILTTNSVGIHIRRNDFVSNGQSLCSIEYYKNAINKASSVVPDPHYLIVSDDKEWCRKFINPIIGDSPIFYTDNSGVDGFRDMQLLSECKAKIIANSSFSGWAAWLNHKWFTISPSNFSPDIENVQLSNMVYKKWITVE